MSALAEAYVTIKADSATLPSQLAGVRSMFQNTIQNISGSVAVAGTVWNQLLGYAQQFITEISEAEVTAQRFNTAVSASGRGDYYKQMVEGIAEAKSEVTSFDDDIIKSAAGAIAKFTTLGDDVLGDILPVAMDLAAQSGRGLSDVAVSLGRALENPANASRMLRQAGVNLTPLQRQQIEDMVKLGDVAGATSTILQIAAGKAPGAAEGMANTFSGLKERIQIQVGEIAKAMGASMLPTLKAISSHFLEFLKWIKAVVSDQGSFIGKMVKSSAATVGFIAGLGSVVRVLGVVKWMLMGVSGTMAMVITTVASLAMQFIDFHAVLNWLNETWSKITKAFADTGAIEAVKAEFDKLLAVFSGTGEGGPGIDWAGMFSTLGDWIAQALTWITGFAADTISVVTSLVADWRVHWEILKNYMATKLLEMVAYFQEQWPKTTAVVVAMVSVVKAVVQNALDWIKYLVSGAGDFLINSKFGKIASVIVGPISEAFKAARDQLGEVAKPENLDFSQIAQIASDAYTESITTGSSKTRDALDELARDRLKLDQQLADAATQRDNAAAKRREDARAKQEQADKEEADFWAWMEMSGYLDPEPYKGVPGAKAPKATQEVKVSAGFVGISEFAKQFQAALLKPDNDQKKIAENTGQTNKLLEDVLDEMGSGSMFEAGSA